MIKLFTQNLLVNGWLEESKCDIYEEQSEDGAFLSPSEESVAFIKNFARSFVVDLNKDSYCPIPLA